MKKQFLIWSFCALSLSTMLSACKEKEESTDPTLYERVGGTAMVADPNNSGQMIEQGRLTLRSVVDSSIFVIAADPALQKFFPVLFAELGGGNTTGLAALSENLTDFMCSATGSKNSSYAYMGINMKDAHDPAKNSRMAVKANNSEFDAFVNDVGTGLAKNGVTAQNNKELVDDLVALLNTTRADIVQQ